MNFFDGVLDESQAEVAALAREVVASLPVLQTIESNFDLQEARSVLIESGLWSIGIDDELGGGGASLDLRQTALTILGQSHPALAWAIAQADAGATILSNEESLANLLRGVVEGELSVAVVDLDTPHVDLEIQEESISGIIERLDPSGPDPIVIVLGSSSAWVIQPSAISTSEYRATTGFAGAATMSVAVSGYGEHMVELSGLNIDSVRARLQIGGAAIAAGLASAAASASAQYSQERIQFGAPLTNFATVRQSLAEQHNASLTALRISMVAETPAPDVASGTLRDNCERAISVTADSLLSHGGYGYLAEYDIERMVRDAVSLRAPDVSSMMPDR